MSFARTIAQLVIGDLVKVNSSINPIIRALRVSGLSYRYQDMRQDIGKALAWQRVYDSPIVHEVRQKFEPYETIANYDMPDGERYRIFGQSRWYDEPSGQYVQKSSSFYSDTLVDDETLSEEFDDLFGGDERYAGMRFVSFERIGVEHNPSMPHQIVQTR